MLPKNVDFFFLYLKIIYNAISLGNGLEAKKKFGIWWTKIGEGRSPSLLLNKSRCQQENASVGKWTLFGWRGGSSMDLNSKPKVCLEEYLDSFFPQVCFVATTVEWKGFPHTTSNFCKAFQCYCLRSNSGLCSLPPFSRAGISNHGNCELYGQIYPTSSRWPSSSRALQMNISPALYLYSF